MWGSLIFKLYFKFLTDIFGESRVFTFADHATIRKSGEDVNVKIDDDLENMVKRFKTIKLTVNFDKCEAISLGSKKINDINNQATLVVRV